jgi:Ca2+-binding RTX toxin-like protein
LTNDLQNKYENIRGQQDSIERLLKTLEAFNGRDFAPIATNSGSTTLVSFNTSPPAGSSGTGGFVLDINNPVMYNMEQARLNLLNQSYNSLVASVYDALILQTRLKPYLDSISLTLTDSGIGLDFSVLDSLLASQHAINANTAVGDLLELRRLMGDKLEAAGWDGLALLVDWAVTDASDPAVLSTLAEFGYSGGIHTDAAGQVDGGNANDVVAGQAYDPVTGSGQDLMGNGGNDLLLGGAGNDSLSGGTGNDLLHGGAGNDTYRFNLGDGSDTIIEMTGDTGIDAIVFGTGILAGDLDISRDGDNLMFAHVNGKDHLVIANWFNGLADAQRFDNITFADGSILQHDALQLGSSGNDTLIGTSNSHILMGGGGDDILISDGNDWLNGGSGADSMTGSIGDDIYVVDNSGDIVIELEGEGIDTVDARASYTLAANMENLRLVGTANLSGTGNELDNVITGNSGDNLLQGMEGNDTLIGNAGNDTLDGGAGSDIMLGGTGNDTYVVDNLTDTVAEQAGQGMDTIVSPFDYTLGASVENLTLTEGSALTGTGNELDNTIIGNSNDNTLTGLAGNDTLDGGAGADILIGGTGNDTYVVDSLADQTVELAAEGVDTVKSNLTWELGDNLDNLTLTGTSAIDGTGNVLDNVIIGNIADNTLTSLEGNDTLNGGAGVNMLIGGTGNDTYVVDNSGDAVIENSGEGVDQVKSNITYTLTDNVENLTLTGAGNTSATGNTLNNVLTGNTGDNPLYGMAGNDSLSGDLGNDLLDGGAGADAMAGKAGDDIYVVDNIGDVVTENINEGTDTVQSSITYTIGANVENLTLTGTASINGTGNAQENIITGNSGANLLDGGEGADMMAGGTGDDTYVVDNEGDIVTEALNAGTDTVHSGIIYTLGDNLENLVLTGTSDLGGTGNALNNMLTGNNGNNLLDGAVGADIMAGGYGDDTYIVDNVGDVIVETVDSGSDIVQSSVNYSLSANVENLVLIGSSGISGTGNTLDNVITGNAGSNSLSGDAGNDMLDGGTGADNMLGGTDDDIYIVDNVADVVNENLNAGTDTIFSSVGFTLGVNVENLILTGGADIDGAGNQLDNVITGNAGNNILNGGSGNDRYIFNQGGGVDTIIDMQGSDTSTSAAI